MLKRLYITTALALLPTAEQATKQFEKLVHKLDARTVHLESYLEEQAVALAQNSANRRTAMERVHAFIAAADRLASKLFDTVDAAFTRREKAIIADITELRAHLDKASDIRDGVAKLLNL